MKFESQIRNITSQLETVATALMKIKTNKRFHIILGCILKVGNCMNAGNKNRGRADGFHLDALSKTMSIKDGDGVSILQMCCTLLHQKDPEFINFKSEFEESYDSIKCVIGDLQKDAAKASADLIIFEKLFEHLKKVDDEVEDVKFGTTLNSFFNHSK